MREICEAAEINRATFYRYYDNPFDLMDKIEREYLTELTSLIGEVEPGRMRESLQAMLGFLKENRGDCLVLFLENGDPDFALRAIGECFQKMLPNLDGIIPGKDQAEREWLFHYMAQGCAAALGSWMRGGMERERGAFGRFSGGLQHQATRTLAIRRELAVPFQNRVADPSVVVPPLSQRMLMSVAGKPMTSQTLDTGLSGLWLIEKPKEAFALGTISSATSYAHESAAASTSSPSTWMSTVSPSMVTRLSPCMSSASTIRKLHPSRRRATGQSFRPRLVLVGFGGLVVVGAEPKTLAVHVRQVKRIVGEQVARLRHAVGHAIPCRTRRCGHRRNRL